MITERVWRTIDESAIAMLLTALLSEIYWQEARNTACYLCNRSPGAHAELNPVAPYELYYGNTSRYLDHDAIPWKSRRHTVTMAKKPKLECLLATKISKQLDGRFIDQLLMTLLLPYMLNLRMANSTKFMMPYSILR